MVQLGGLGKSQPTGRRISTGSNRDFSLLYSGGSQLLSSLSYSGSGQALVHSHGIPSVSVGHRGYEQPDRHSPHPIGPRSIIGVFLPDPPRRGIFFETIGSKPRPKLAGSGLNPDLPALHFLQPGIPDRNHGAHVLGLVCDGIRRDHAPTVLGLARIDQFVWGCRRCGKGHHPDGFYTALRRVERISDISIGSDPAMGRTKPQVALGARHRPPTRPRHHRVGPVCGWG